VAGFFPNGLTTLNLGVLPIGDMVSPFSAIEGSGRLPLFLSVSIVFLKPPPNRPALESRRERISLDSSAVTSPGRDSREGKLSRWPGPSDSERGELFEGSFSTKN